jgi:hypothetical protein
MDGKGGPMKGRLNLPSLYKRLLPQPLLLRIITLTPTTCFFYQAIITACQYYTPEHHQIMSPTPTAASTAPSNDTTTSAKETLYGDGISVMSQQGMESAIAANNTLVETLLRAGIEDPTVTNGLKYCNMLYPVYHNNTRGEQCRLQARILEGEWVPVRFMAIALK